MNASEEKFVLLVDKIVRSEMDEIQVGEYEIEGKEWIERFFDGNADPSLELQEPGVRYGLSPEALEALKEVASFGTLILSILTFYFDRRKIATKA